VIVPIYNVAEHIAACIESLRTQTLTDFDVLMIDDGSTDQSGQIALDAAQGDPRFRLITQQNAGLSGARNTGLDAATGAYIAFIDSDDCVMLDYLMRLWRTLEETGGDWVACAIQSRAPDGTGTRHSAIHGKSDLAEHVVTRRYPFNSWSDVICHFPSAWNKLYRRSLIEGLRFDEGTWFEDHGFFYRAAARTDHIIHLPEALYIQTRGREGQITSQDSERVFEQFDVLDEIKRVFATTKRAGGDLAFARIASRLMFERSTVITDPERRARFAKTAQDYLNQHGLTYRTDWDHDIALSWPLEMEGTLPLSVILHWDGQDASALKRSLDSLKAQSAPAHELLIVCQNQAARAALSSMELSARSRIMTAVQNTQGAAFNHGLAHANGAYVVFVETGDALTPWSLLHSVEAMLRANADFGIGQIELQDNATGVLTYHNGIHDMGLWSNTPPVTGPLDMTPMQVLSLEAHCSAKVFRRSFLQEHGFGFTDGPRPDWALCLMAALRAQVTTYLDRAGVRVTMTDQSFDRWRAPHSAQAMIQGHAALLETVSTRLNPAEQAQLPRGWQRRLFARSLREQVYFGTYAARAQRLSMLLGAARAAMRYGYGPAQPAGIDPAVGPRLIRMMDPVRIAQRKLGLKTHNTRPEHGAPTPQIPDMTETGTPAPQPYHYKTLHPFNLGRSGVLHLRADFYAKDYANIYFHANGHQQVLFHLSLRQKEGVVACNDQHPDGTWRKERLHAVDLSNRCTDVVITFDLPHVTITLNGQTLFRFGRKSLRNRNGFSDLDRITGFTLQGEFSTTHVVPRVPTGGVILDTRLMLRTAHSTTTDPHIQPAGITLPLITAPYNTAAALLPGRVWNGVAVDQPITVTHGDSDPLTLTRFDMATRIEALLALPLAPTDSTLCLTVLEHVRYGALRPLLSPSACEQLDAITAFYSAKPFMEAGSEQAGTPQPPPPALPVDTIGRDVTSAVARLAQSQNAPADQRPDPLAVVHGLHVAPSAQQFMFMALTEHFCTQGQDMDGLIDLARVRGVLPLTLPADLWSLSTALPYLLADHRYEELCATMKKLAAPAEGWLVTPAIAWTVRRTLLDADIPQNIRDTVFDSFATLLRNGAADYWDRVHCRELTYTAVAVLCAQTHRRDDVTALCLEVYGLSRQFWRDLETATDLPADMLQARAAYHRITDTHNTDSQREAALRLFEAAHNTDTARLRREIFGPASRPEATLEDPADTDHMPQNMLRHMASPNAVDLRPDLARLATAALPRLYPETPRAPDFAGQQATAQKARALLANPDAGIDPAELSALTDGMSKLAGAKAHHLGLGMALALIDTLHDRDTRATRTLCDWLIQQTALLDPATWRAAPAVVQPLRRLRLRGTFLPCIQTLFENLDLPTSPLDSADNNGLPDGVALFDTIVTVFSCAPYLDTRIPAMRAGWLGLLEDMGIPYVIVVGNGDGTRTGDVVHLDAPDDYEGLPQKTLATIRWVHDNTRFGHMLKIDDDCFLNAPLFFDALSYRKFDYYGRRLHRVAGQMDRIWHQDKSSSARGRAELDKSSEPSEYADGGSAYALSRTAMAAALDAAASPEGRHLISVSFMEDKMLGDLLALRHIHVASEDYRISIRRRTYGDAMPVAAWLNSFFPSQTAPLQLIHLDTHLHQVEALNRQNSPGLWPRKIWPSYQDVKLGYQSNALELITPEDSVARARDAKVTVVACMRNEMFMLPHFLAHYRKLGVTAFLIADNCSDDGTLEYLAAQPDVALFSVDTDYKSSRYGVAWQQAMMAAFRVGKWSLVADADELLVWQEKQSQTLPDLLDHPDFETADAARIFMLDMYPEGPLEHADFGTQTPFEQAGFADTTPFLTNSVSRGPFSNQPTWTSALRHRLIAGSPPNLFVAQKLALLRYKPWMRLSAGLHFVGDVDIAPRELLFAHFKYNADFRRKAQVEVLRGQHFNDAEEYRKYLAMVSEGRSVIFDPALSAPWANVPFVQRRLVP